LQKNIQRAITPCGHDCLPELVENPLDFNVIGSAGTTGHETQEIASAISSSTRTGGLFLFISDLVRLDSDARAQAAQLPARA
jgi:hypothetical protein